MTVLAPTEQLELDHHPRWRLDVACYDGTRIEYPLPEDFTWEEARATKVALRRQFPGRVARVSILSQRDRRPLVGRVGW